MLAPSPELDARYLGTAEDASGKNKIEVWSRCDADGGTRVEVTQFAWGSGIGWYAQKTLELDEQQIEGLLEALGRVRPAPKRARSVENVIVLPFAR